MSLRAFIPLALLACLTPSGAHAQTLPAAAPVACKPVYLVFESASMQSARLVALALRRAQVKATFFVGNGPTADGHGALSRQWASWWKERGAEGHALAVLPWDLPLWRGDMRGREPSFRIRPLTGAFAGREFTWSAKKYCDSLGNTSERLGYYSEQKPLPLFHAIEGKTSPSLLATAKSCGYTHVSWPATYFAGDAVTGDALLKRSFEQVKEGDILLSHLGAWPGQDESAPAVLAPLLQGLKDRGVCFHTLASRPAP